MRAMNLLVLFLGSASAFLAPVPPKGAAVTKRGGPVFADVEVSFSGKKVKGKPGDSLKALAGKARANINYGCEEGKCGTCEHKGSDGKKYRVCIAKVPKIAGPLTLKP